MSIVQRNSRHSYTLKLRDPSSTDSRGCVDISKIASCRQRSSDHDADATVSFCLIVSFRLLGIVIYPVHQVYIHLVAILVHGYRLAALQLI